MSEFDKEAEREKLREKYEHEQQDREATERMSDLLLKGATMTNAHCGTCGDPIFRHEGQEFCPTCQEVVTEAQQDEPQDDAADSGPETEVDEPSATDAAAVDATGADAEPDTSARSAASTAAVDQDAQSVDRTHAREQQPGPDPAAAAATPASGPDVGSQRAEPAVDVDGRSLADARASLSRTVTRLAQQAESSDDLERARAYLAATEEAADALAAVKQADR